MEEFATIARPILLLSEVFNVLGDSSKTEVVFASTLSEAEEEVGGVVVFHELPSLVDDEKAALLIGANDVPDVRKNNIHGDGTEFVLEVADVEDDHLVIDVDI